MIKRIIFFSIAFLNIFTIAVYAKYSSDCIEIIATVKIDNTPPKVEVKYSSLENNVDYVEVYIYVNEEIQKIQEFDQVDKLTYKKIFYSNVENQLIVKDLSGNEQVVYIKITNILNNPIEISCSKIINNNSNTKFANKNKIIDFDFLINKEIYKIDEEKIEVLVNDKLVENKIIIKDVEFKYKKSFTIEVMNIAGNGKLTLKLNSKFLMDKNSIISDEVKIDTGIIIDNINPICFTKEEVIANGKSDITISSNEEIQKIDGWEIDYSNMILRKEYPSNISYKMNVSDYAGNFSEVEINIKKASYIKLTYASHNSTIGWTYGYGNYDIAGMKAIQENPIYKTESLAFKIEGNVDNDFLQVRANVYTYWGVGTYARCTDTGHIYYYGENPLNNQWASLGTPYERVYIGQDVFFQLGGAGVNRIGQLALVGIVPIPTNVALEYKYGISSIAIKLKEYSDYDVVYQIFVNGQGWIKCGKNEEEVSAGENFPFSAIRMGIIPKSETNNLIIDWNKDIGKYNIK